MSAAEVKQLVERLPDEHELLIAWLEHAAKHARLSHWEGSQAIPDYGDRLARKMLEVRAALSLLAQERDELRTDKDRLDFLDNLNAALNKRYGTSYSWTLIFNHNVTRLMLGGHLVVDLNDSEARGLPSCRNAIDAKRSEVAARAALKDT